MSIEKDIVGLIQEQGPLTGAELLERKDGDHLVIWRTCMLSRNLFIQTIGRRYLRLDRRIAGFARLSPSILREFLTYSVVGLAGDPGAAARKAAEVLAHIESVTRSKSGLAYEIVSAAMNRFDLSETARHQIAVLIAGDIVYNMAHDVPRPERSTGRMVQGSDMDIVVIVDDRFPKEQIRPLDDAIFQEKQRILMTPHIREEIDYVVKDMARVRDQMTFDTFRHKVACKILQEGTLLYGSEHLFSAIKAMLRREGVAEKLSTLEHRADTFRTDAIKALLQEDPLKIKAEHQDLFYPTEESEEFE